MPFTIQATYDLLLNENLLKELVTTTGWHLAKHTLPLKEFRQLSYDSRQTDADTLFFCKGLNFKVEYLAAAVDRGLEFYVAEEPFDVAATGLIVTDIKKAMALIAMAFYDRPQEKLQLIAFTGTKGKTTAAYFTQTILAESTHHKTALLSTMNTTLDGQTFFKSELTTPESLDLYRMMAEAVANGMTHLVMEVSSQAYKTERVYGLTYDVGIFLNISPDHISPIEHPTFDDYFYCKRQILRHAKKMIVNRQTDYFDLIAETCQLNDVPLITYGRADADYLVTTDPENSLAFALESKADRLKLNGDYEILLAGDFNQDNAAAALIAASLVGATKHDGQIGLAKARVPGRMDRLLKANGATVYVDYAHNYLSLQSLLEFAQEEHPVGKVIVVLGSPGGKAISRRKDFGTVLSQLADIAILTADDPALEDSRDIAQQIADAVTNPALTLHFEMDRPTAIKQALAMAEATDAVIIAGKGQDEYQKVNGENVYYAGDYAIAKALIAEEKTE